MSTLNDVVINKLSGGLGRRNPSQDMVSGLLFNATSALAEGVETNKAYRLASVEDAKALGITEAYDVNGQSAYYQIQQYFRMNPSGDLFIMPISEDGSYPDVAVYAQSFQEATGGAIRQMAIIFSDDTTLSETIEAAQAAQLRVDAATANYMPFEVLLEGKGFATALAAGHESIINLAEVNASNVSIVVAMDVEVALDQSSILVVKGATEAEDVYANKNFTNTAAVGMALGAISRAKVSENIAWVEKFNLAGAGFSKAGFVGGTEVSTQFIQETLNERRYIFARTHTGLPGVYFNDSHTASIGTSDFAYIENNRAINKATRLLRTALLPKLNSPILVDEAGQLAPSVTKGFETLCRAALEGMVSNQEVSAFDVFVDPAQNILATSELRIKAEVTPVGTARKIIVNLGFKNPFGLNA